jgi:hypothetical protein
VSSLNNITFFVANKESLQQPVTFALDYDSPDNQSAPQIRHLLVNGVTCYPIDYFGAWDNDIQGFRAYLVFELWLYSDSLGRFQNHERFVDLVLNLRG